MFISLGMSHGPRSFEIILRIIGGMKKLHITKSALRMRDDSLPTAAPSFICAGVFDKWTMLSKVVYKDQIALRNTPGTPIHNNVMMLAKTQSFSYSR